MTKVRIALMLTVVAAVYVAALNLCAVSLPLGIVAMFATVFTVDPAIHWVHNTRR